MKELKALVVNEAGEILGCSTKDLPQLSNVNFLILLTNPSSTFRSELHVNHIISVPQFPFSQKQIYVFFFYLPSNRIFARKYLYCTEMFERKVPRNSIYNCGSFKIFKSILYEETWIMEDNDFEGDKRQKKTK